MMEETKPENTKLANQAWRKKPRKFAPKSRLGCKTCKIRRVKCDLTRPSCLKCSSTGRTCDGYCDASPTFNVTTTQRAGNTESCNNHQPCTTINAFQPEKWRAECRGLTSQNLGSFMILPATSSGQAEAMFFFENVSIKHLNEHHPSESWRNTLMQFSQTVPAVRHAATALALIHRYYLDRKFGDRIYHPQSLKDWSPDQTPLLHYNKAIELLINQDSSDSDQTSAITLLVCYLFICFDHLTGNDVQAKKHLRGGVDLSCNIKKALLSTDTTHHDAASSGLSPLIRQVTRQIRRLDMQAVMFVVDWTPADIQETCISQLLPSHNAFWSIDQAADDLQILIARAMTLYWEQQMSTMREISPSPPASRDFVLRQLESWSSLFETMLQQSSFHETDPETLRLASVMRLQHTIAWTLLFSLGPGREMAYDDFLPQFQKCVAMAADIVTAHEQYLGPSMPTFTPEIGIIPILYIIGVKCRHPLVRREVLSILRRQPIREAVWDSTATARVVERVIEIEEVGCTEQSVIPSMEQIPILQRIEALSWIHDVEAQSAAKLVISYTFCAREGTYTESLNC